MRFHGFSFVVDSPRTSWLNRRPFTGRGGARATLDRK
jgi:hypothetical protein